MAKKSNKKKKKSNGARKSSASIGDKVARQGINTDPNAKPKGLFGGNTFGGLVVGFVILLVTIALLAFQ